jgi:hypothetical protein
VPRFARTILLFSVFFGGNWTHPAFGQGDHGYSIGYVRATPKRGTHLVVGDHVVLSVTVKYKLYVTDTGTITLVLQKDDDSLLMPGHKQVKAEVSRGSGQTTLTDEFDVPAGTRSVRLFIPLTPTGYPRTSGEVLIEYPVKKR